MKFLFGFLFVPFVFTYLKGTLNFAEVGVPKMRRFKNEVCKLFYTKFIETSCIFVTVKQGKESDFSFQRVEEDRKKSLCYVPLNCNCL